VTTSKLIFTVWDFYPSVIVGSLALLVGYGFLVHWRFHRRALLFAAGVLAMAWALLSFLDVLGDGYLFSAHMAQHLILIEIVPILLLLGTPPEGMERLLKIPLLARAERSLGNPWVAWLAGILVLYAWHLPALYNTALASESMHVFQHLSFLVTSTMFWWPILSPVQRCRVSPPVAFLYLMGAAIANTLLGIVVAYVPPGTYPAYNHPADPLGILPLVRDQWHLDRASDQILGGMLMWVPGGLVCAAVIFNVLARWYAESDLAAEIAGQEPGGARPGRN
jgi:putative membrane protein